MSVMKPTGPEIEDHNDMFAVITKEELAELGNDEVAYIREMTADEASEAFPTIEGLPDDTNLFALHAADGRPLALTDDRGAAIEHAMSDELEIATLH